MRKALAALALASLLGCSRAPAPPHHGGRTLIVGDSLTKGAYSHLSRYCPDAEIVAEEGKGLEWMQERIAEKFGERAYGTVFVLGGINNIAGGAQTPQVMAGIDGIAQLALQYDAHPVFGTITPFKGYDHGRYSWTESKQRVADAVNLHIRRYEHLDTFSALGSPYDASALLPRYERTIAQDHLHLGDAGLERLAKEISGVCR